MNPLRSALQTLQIVFARSVSGVHSGLLIFTMVALNLVTNVGATTGFAISGRSHTSRGFIVWQIIGGFFGLGTQLTFAGLVRFTSVQIASAVGIGLAFLLAEVVSAYFVFHETFTNVQWLGVIITFLGLLLIIWGRP
jgi:drug/metabolite transporter (DMT)-like permease